MYDFEVKFCKTKDFGQAEGLWWLINTRQLEEEDSIISAVFAEQATISLWDSETVNFQWRAILVPELPLFSLWVICCLSSKQRDD